MESPSLFDQHRPLLFSIAYRMLGSVEDTEDMIQESYLKWVEKGKPDVESPKSYFSTIISRLCIDHLRSAKVNREVYAGPWLPEPLLGDEESPIAPLEQADSISTAFLVVLEKLSPMERAVFLLRQAFDYDYSEIAAVVQKSEANCRKIFSRAKKQVSQGRPKLEAPRKKHESLLKGFVDAFSKGNIEAMLPLLDPDCTMISDGGGKVIAAKRPIQTALSVARFFNRIRTASIEDNTVVFTQVNGKQGFIIYKDDVPQSVFSIETNGHQIEAIYIVRNPDKLKRLGAASFDLLNGQFDEADQVV